MILHLVREHNRPQELALELLQQSWQLKLEVNTMTYNAAISACEMLGNDLQHAACSGNRVLFIAVAPVVGWVQCRHNVYSHFLSDALNDASAKNPSQV